VTVAHPSRHVLVVDDDEDVRLFLATTLEMFEFSVSVACDGREAEALAHALLPSVVLLDVMMPDRDGFEVLRKLKGDESTRDIPVVLVTAKVTDDDLWTGWANGAAYYITKPFDPDHLLEFLEALMAGREFTSLDTKAPRTSVL
jgi:DNA-binding response OmpR family regulator